MVNINNILGIKNFDEYDIDTDIVIPQYNMPINIWE